MSIRQYILLICLAATTTINTVTAAEAEDDAAAAEPEDSETLLQAAPGELALTTNEPVYFIVGDRDKNTTARFQFSFDYRMFDRQGLLARAFPFFGDLHFAYTQTSLWNLSDESAPFYDNSYRPSLFWQSGELSGGLFPSNLRAGLEHESNGQEGLASRSIDTLFIQPVWRRQWGKRELLVMPRFIHYLDMAENPGIKNYRGYGDLVVRYGREDSWNIGSSIRVGTEGYSSVRLDISYPIRTPIFLRTGGFIYLQMFHGYGETLLDYDQKSDFQVRLGFAIVR